MTKPRITLERTYDAPLDDIWELWTTKDGVESWWGPEGFAIKVQAMDVRPGGEMAYLMIAVAPDMVAFMKKANMPIEVPSRFTYTEVAPKTRLAFRHTVDFVPGVATYDVETSVDFHPAAGGIRLVLTLDAMHDAEWTDRMAKGWEMQLGKLARSLAPENQA